jgi:aminoglycoside/choline kinase family phosphotransferase
MLASPSFRSVTSAASQSSDPGERRLDWLRRAGWSGASIEALTGDVSPRRYYRVRSADGRAAVLATYPDELLETCDRFAASHRLLAARGVRVPAILAVDCRAGSMLLEDLGGVTLYDQRQRGWDYLGPRLEAAAAIGARIADLDPAAVGALNPPLDLALMASELERTWSVTLGVESPARAGLPPALEEGLQAMLAALAAAPRAPCHRDFMARNLVPVDAAGGRPASGAPELGVLDFQDLRLGPHTYDIASLLNDSLYAPAELEESVLARRPGSGDERLDYHRGAAQRTLKIVGTFVSFARRGFPRHLGLVEPTLRAARRHLRRLPELGAARGAIDTLCEALLAGSGVG